MKAILLNIFLLCNLQIHASEDFETFKSFYTKYKKNPESMIFEGAKIVSDDNKNIEVKWLTYWCLSSIPLDKMNEIQKQHVIYSSSFLLQTPSNQLSTEIFFYLLEQQSLSPVQKNHLLSLALTDFNNSPSLFIRISKHFRQADQKLKTKFFSETYDLLQREEKKRFKNNLIIQKLNKLLDEFFL